MTSKDKTGDQLVASIRKSKTGSVASKTAAVKPQTEAVPRAPTVSAARKRQQDDSRSRDNYSVGRRVWPD